MSLRLRHPVLWLCLFGLLSVASVAAADTQQVFTHLFVVPAVPADGGDATEKTTAFETWLTETFGGYTCLGAGHGGWKNEAGVIETEANTVYLTTAGRDFSKEIGARLMQDFGMRVPYVLVFPAELFAKRPE